MSLILDALRKMEQERRSRQGAALDIRPEVLRYRAVLKPRQARPYLLAGSALLLLAAGLGAGAFLKGRATEPKLPPAGVATLAAPAPPTLATEAPATSTTIGRGQPATELSPATMQPPTAAASAAVNGVAEPSPAAQGEPSHRTVHRRGASTAPSVEEPPARVRSKAPQPEPAGAIQAAPQDISVSGIAYQDERSLRRAVVNGTLVGEGAEVAGGRVVEIRENKVRMSRGGQLFDVALSSGLPGR